jgi:SPP1 gp7 family putative phage head morphogenesis protein
MARVTGPSRDELDARGDEFAARVTRAIRTTLRDVTATTRDVDDLTRIQTVWNSVVRHALAPHLRATWNTAVEGVRGQLEKINDRQRETLVAAVFEIPKVSNPLAEAFLADATNRLVAIGDVVWFTARGEMLTGLQLGEGVAELKKRVVESANVSSKQAEVIARTEVNSAMNNGAYQQMKALDVPTVKEWIATSDSRTRKSHAAVDGEEIDGDAKFTVGGHLMAHPHDTTAPPGETINCRCTLAWEIADDEDDYEDELVAAGMRCNSFHLPGRHEQKKHGNRKSKKSAVNAGTSLDAIRSDYDTRITQAARDDDVFDATGIRDKRALYKRIRQNDDELGGVEGDVIRSSINDYVNNGYTKYNTALRQDDDSDVAEGVRAIDAAINESSLTNDVVMWRGVLDPSVTFGSAWKATGDNSGLTYVDHGYSSLSAYEEVADNFSTRYGMETNGVKMRILIPKGKKLLGVEQNIEDEANSEGELLGERGLKFRVVRDYSSPGPKQGTTVRTLDVEVVD